MDFHTNLLPNERLAYEQYCLADTLEGKLTALNKLIEGSDLYNYLYFATKMRENKCSISKLPQKDRELFESKMAKQNNQYVKAVKAMNALYEFDEAYQSGKQADWKKKLSEIREEYFGGIDLAPSKPHFAQSLAVKKAKKADAPESSDDEAKPATQEELKKATLQPDFFSENEKLQSIYR